MRVPATIVALVMLWTLGTATPAAPPAPGAAASSQGRSKVKAMVRRTPQLDSLIASGRIEVLERYGGTTMLVSGTESDLHPGRRRVEDKIHLRARTIDTSQASIQMTTASSRRLEMLQFHGPVKASWLEDLRAAGARPIAYLPHNAYIVWVDDPSSLSASKLPIQWRGPLNAADRISPDLASTPGSVDVTVQLARTGAHGGAVDRIRSSASAILMEPHDVGRLSSIRVTLPRAAIDEIALLAEVVWIEPYEPIRTHDERSALITAGQVARGRVLGPGYLSWLAAHGLSDLSGTIVDVTDTGIDSGGTTVTQPGLRGRVAYSDDMTGEGKLEDCAGHGTNVAGIIAGGFAPGAQFLDSDGYLLGLGVVPSARIGATRIFDCAGQFDPAVSFSELVASAWRHGARIGNNSWGGRGTQYNSVSAEYDALVRDADSDPTNGDQGFLPVFSTGNFGPSTLSVGWPATAKNVLSVGATENYRLDGSDGCGTSNILADSVDHVLTYSSRGPTADGRFKPDLVAPGSHVQSLASTSADYTGVGVCDAYYPPGQHLLNWSTGTSQAAAHVTGAAVIAAEIFRREVGAPPSPAMIKAMLINHAHDMGTTLATPSNTTSRPNTSQGWGRADVGSLVEERARLFFDQQHVMTATGEVFTLEPVIPDDPNRPVLVTLTWTDAPGTPIGWSFVNDLDLVVEADGVEYLGNVLDHGVSVTGGSADGRNNVEIVALPAGARSLRITVEAPNLAGDGVPSTAGETDQDFALYASNVRLAGDHGLIDFGRPAAACGSILPIRLADRQLRGFGATQASVEAGVDTETVLMREDPAGSGVFGGAIDVAAGAAVPGDGVLQASEALPVRASYARLAAGTGNPQTRTTTTVARCTPPVITQARVTLVGDSEATIRWTTDRPADSVVAFGPGTSRTLLSADPKLVTEHAVRLRGLAGCSLHTATVSSTDVSGMTGTGPPSPLRFSTGSSASGRILFQDDMETLGSRWTHGSAVTGAIDDWELGHPAAGPPGAFSGTRVWGTNLDGNYSLGVDSVLVSPPIDLRDVLGARLTFMHHYAISGGRTPASLNDGAWVEVTSDGGANWAPIDPLGGYPDTIDEDNPYLSSTTGVYAGVLTGWVKATFDLSAFSGQLLQIRFHLWQDAAESQPLASGWYIDDVEVRAEGNCHVGRLALDGDDYGCSSRVTVLLSDTDLNAGPSVADTATVTASSALGQLPLTLTETGPATGQFRATLELAPSPSAGKLAVAEGGVVSFSYLDADSGGGTPATVTASAMVSDCTPPPAPSTVSARAIATGALSLTWAPVDPAAAPDLQGYRIYYDTDASGPTYGGAGAFQGISPLRVEAAPTAMTLTSLGGCSPHFITVTAFDRFGNESPFAPESTAVPDGSSPCAAGRLSAYPAAPGCRQSVSITVADSNADPDLSSAGSVTVSATGPSHPGALNVTLTESGPASGVFIGPLLLSPAALPGALTTAEGDDVSLQYPDADDGRGQPRAAVATVRVSDCTPPAISDVTVTSRSGDRAVVRWTTDEPATSTIAYGLDPSLGLGATSPGLTRQHAVAIVDLPACSPVYYTITSTDARGNTSAAGDGGSPLRFGTYREVPDFTDDFETGAPGWTHQGFPAGNGLWELGVPVPGVNGGPPSAYSGAAVWGTDLDGSYPDGADLVLVSPSMDLTQAKAATLSFRHWYDIWSSGLPNGFDDGGFLEISIDGGATWTHITPVGGYPDRLSGNPYMPFGAGGFAGLSSGWQSASFVLDDWVGHQVRMRFHLFEDPGEISPAPHAGWYIDDVVLRHAVACHDALLEMDRAEYGCDGSAVTLNLYDLDLDTDPLALDMGIVRLESDAEPSGEIIELTETGLSTGQFRATVPISSVDAAGVLAVRQDDTLVASYEDADDGTGAPRVATAVARVPDCTPPVITGFRLADVTDGSFRVEWNTSEAGDSRVLFGETPALGGSVVVPGSRTTHSISVTGLQPCTKYFFTVASTDMLGNAAREDAMSGLREVVSASPIDLVSEGFESGAPGWTHIGTGDTWQFAVVSGAGAAVTAPGGSYARPTGGANSDFVLLSPSVNLAGITHPILTLRHDYDFPSSFQGGDGGWVEAWDGSFWRTLTPEGGYPSFVDPEAGRTGSRLPAYAGRSAGTSVSRFDLAGVAASVASNGAAETRIRFHVFVEDGVGPTGAGWAIHDATIAGDVACRRGRLAFEQATVTCSSVVAGLRLHDRDLDLDGGAIDSATVTMTSSGGPASLAVTLMETSSASGDFRGAAPLTPGGDPGTLRAQPGDRISVSYPDADDGSGVPAVVSTEATVRACAGPAIDRVSLTPTGDGFVAQWATDRPATSELILQPPVGPALAASDHRLVTSHRLAVSGAAPCASYTAAIASQDSDGLRGTAGPSGKLAAENSERSILFIDTMEGANPGWTLSGLHIEWQRGVPLFGPPSAFSGQRVFATDLTGMYDGGTNSTLTSPPIDLTGVSSARLTFWHWYDIFADSPPNSTDDSAWVEVQVAGSFNPVYIEPIGGYPDTTDAEGGEPLLEGTSAYAGQSGDWEKATFDLTPFAGQVIRVRFRIWNDFIELLVNGHTGAGWYIDDVEVSAPRFCHPAPLVTSPPLGSVTQGGSRAGLAIDGTGFRAGATIALGAGVTVSSPPVVSPTRVVFDLSVDPGAVPGPRDLTLVNPDGQTATLSAALTVALDPRRVDIDGSGRVDGGDLAALAAAFGAAEGESRYRLAADLDGDAFVDGRDLAILAASFGATF